MRQTHGWLSLLLLPITAALFVTAIGLPQRPSTGFKLRGDHVEEVTAGSPAARAGLRPGDRLLPATPHGRVARSSGEILAGLAPGEAVPLRVERDGVVHPVTLVPARLPSGDFRLLAIQLMVAFGFLLIASLVWSERRDALTAVFTLLLLSFAILVAPPPQWRSAAPALLYDVAYSGITLFLPALFVHFFVLFPESARPRGAIGTGVRLGYLVAGLLFGASLLPHLLPPGPGARVEPAFRSLDVLAAMWFLAGVLAAAGLFVRSFRAAESGDARRRLRVALAGTLLGVAPLAAVNVARSVAPGTRLPGEEAAVVMTLLLPAAFAWAIVVHRIFDLKIALRAFFAVGVLTLGALATLVVADRGAETLGRAKADRLASGALTLMALGAFGAGPFLSRMRPRRVALDVPTPPVPAGRVAPPAMATREGLLESACRTLVADLRLTGCAAIDLRPDRPRLVADAGSLGAGPLGPAFRAALGVAAGVAVPEGLNLEPADRDALDLGGVRWIVPIGHPDADAALLLGGRLAGSWLAPYELSELERFAAHLEVALENFDLRREASTHVAFHRELREARSIQAHFLPRRVPAYPTLDCAAAAFMSESVGGDYYDFVETGGRDFTLAVGDAAGKGVPAALLLAGVQSRFRSEARRGLAPSELLGALNRQLVQLEQPEKFVGLLCARVDVRRARIGFANAGLMPPLIRRRCGRFEEVTEGGVLLGVRADASYRDRWMELERGDVAILYTDGLTEARRGEEMFGVERVASVLAGHAGRRASEILQAVLAAVRSFADEPLDDLTVVVLRQLTDPPHRQMRVA